MARVIYDYEKNGETPESNLRRQAKKINFNFSCWILTTAMVTSIFCVSVFIVLLPVMNDVLIRLSKSKTYLITGLVAFSLLILLIFIYRLIAHLMSVYRSYDVSASFQRNPFDNGYLLVDLDSSSPKILLYGPVYDCRHMNLFDLKQTFFINILYRSVCYKVYFNFDGFGGSNKPRPELSTEDIRNAFAVKGLEGEIHDWIRERMTSLGIQANQISVGGPPNLSARYFAEISI